MTDDALKPSPIAGKRFRYRIIPATLLWCFCPLSLVLYLVGAGMASYTYIKYRWIAPEPGIILDLHERFLSPPVVAYFILSFSAIVCGLFAAPAWYRGNWRRAVAFTVLFFVLGGLASYIASGESMRTR